MQFTRTTNALVHLIYTENRGILLIAHYYQWRFKHDDSNRIHSNFQFHSSCSSYSAVGTHNCHRYYVPKDCCQELIPSTKAYDSNGWIVLNEPTAEHPKNSLNPRGTSTENENNHHYDIVFFRRLALHYFAF